MRRHPLRGTGASRMLVGVAVAAGAALGVLIPVTAALAEDATPTSTAEAGATADPNLGPAKAGEAACTVANAALNEITGMVATDMGIYVVEGGDSEQPSNVRIHTLNAENCRATA